MDYTMGPRLLHPIRAIIAFQNGWPLFGAAHFLGGAAEWLPHRDRLGVCSNDVIALELYHDVPRTAGRWIAATKPLPLSARIRLMNGINLCGPGGAGCLGRLAPLYQQHGRVGVQGIAG